MLPERMTDSRDTPQATSPFTAAGVMRGVRQSLPLAASVFVYGLIFGLLAKTASLTMAEAMLMSGFVFSGSAQMVAVNGMAGGQVPTGAAFLTIGTTILLLNARYLLYGAALRPWLGGVPAPHAYVTLAVLGDGNWILSLKAEREGERDAGFIFGSGAAMFVPWLVGTFAGMTAGAFAADPRAFGLDFMLIAFSAALAAGLIRGRGDLAVLAVAVIAAVAADRLIGAGYAVISAALAGGLTAWLRFREPASP
jgi:predicted branched-subunit amino acid permease